MNYVVLNILVLIALAAVLFVARVRIQWRITGVVLGILLLLTVIFDNVIIGAGLVAYVPQFISGVRLWLAPIEDFAYSIAAVMVVVLIWQKGLNNAERS